MFDPPRTALVAVLLPFGMAACGDELVVGDGTAPLSAAFAPGTQTVAVGATASFALNVTGGTGTAMWTCSASPAPAIAQNTTNGCSASSSSSGSYLVTAVVTKGSETLTVSASLTVAAVVTMPATVTIAAINQGGAPAPIGNIQGQVDVVLNIERGTEILESVDLLVDNTVVASQTLGVAAAAEGDGPDAQAVQNITLSFNSGCYTSGAAGAACGTVDEEAGVAIVRHANGSHTVSA